MRLDKLFLKTFWIGLAVICPVAVGWSLVSCNGYTNKAYEVGIAIGGMIAVWFFANLFSSKK